MDIHPLKYCLPFLRRAIVSAKEAFSRKTAATEFPSYRYDTTGRIVHYGPGGEVLEQDSAFWVVDVRYKQAARSRSVSRKAD
jgi:hypothetical protein